MEGSKRAERTFTVTALDPETQEVDRNAVMAALGDIEASGHRLGGAWIATPVRQEMPVLWDSEGREVRREHKTIAWIFEFVKYVPAVSAPTSTASEAGDAAALLEAERQAAEQSEAARQMIEEGGEGVAEIPVDGDPKELLPQG